MAALEEKIASLTSQLNESNDRSEAMIKSLTSQLSEVEKKYKLLSGDHDALSNISLDVSNDKLSLSSSLNQRFRNQLKETEANNAYLTSQLNEASNKLSEVEKSYKLLSGDHDALSHISLEQCDELILTSNHNQEKLLQRRVSNETYLYYGHCYIVEE